MGELTLTAGIAILILLAILPYIAIVGTWTEIKQLNNKIEETNQILETLTKSVMEIRERQKIQEIKNIKESQSECEWLSSEQRT